MSILGILAGAASLVGGISKLATSKKRDKRTLAINKELAKVNYEYGEMAADNAHERTLALNESQNLQNQVADAEAAGLSPGLFYGGAGGGGGSQSGAQSSPRAGNIEATETASLLEVQQLINETKLQQAETKRVKFEAEQAKAEKERTEAETENIREQTNTSKELTLIQKELLKEQAIQIWIENARKKWENEGNEPNTQNKYVNKELGTETNITTWGNFDKKQAAEIAEITTNAELNTEKKIGYWKELLNATKQADAAAVQAAAVKLAAEWSTGEFTNWKTWKEAAEKSVGTLVDIVTKGIK